MQATTVQERVRTNLNNCHFSLGLQIEYWLIYLRTFFELSRPLYQTLTVALVIILKGALKEATGAAVRGCPARYVKCHLRSGDPVPQWYPFHLFLLGFP